ncbi:MAG: hypothetical protein AAFP18_12720 [Bacteroidota bacterium]
MRSVFAVVAGFIVIVIASVAVDVLIRAVTPAQFSPRGRVDTTLTLLLYSGSAVLYTILGGFVTGRIAPQRPVRHAVWLGMVGLVVGVAASSALWATAPAWYHILGWVLVVPAAYAGGRLAERTRVRKATHAAA